MTTTLRRGFASSLLGALALLLAGCGGGGTGISTPTATPNPNATPTNTPVPTSTPVPGSGGTTVVGNQVVFVSNRNSTSGGTDLYKSNPDGTSVTRLTKFPATISAGVDKPSVSFDGTRVAFQFGDSNSAGGTNNIEIGSINVDGSGFVQLTKDTAVANNPDDYNPVYSSDGRYIYWTSTRGALDANGQATDRVPHIWRMDVSGANQVQAIREPSAYPSLDRNGNLAYVATTNTTQPVAIYNIATQTVTKRIGSGLSTGQGVFGLALSPDGSRVAYTLGMVANGSAMASAQALVFNVGTSARDGGSPAPGTSNRVGNWGRDSQTLFFDSASANSRRQVFSAKTPYSAPTKIPVGDTSDNFSPAFLPGSG